jgi:hypothetical protein
MNISNILRGMVRRGEKVVIGKKTWEAREVEKKPAQAHRQEGVTALPLGWARGPGAPQSAGASSYLGFSTPGNRGVPSPVVGARHPVMH